MKNILILIALKILFFLGMRKLFQLAYRQELKNQGMTHEQFQASLRK